MVLAGRRCSSYSLYNVAESSLDLRRRNELIRRIMQTGASIGAKGEKRKVNATDRSKEKRAATFGGSTSGKERRKEDKADAKTILKHGKYTFAKDEALQVQIEETKIFPTLIVFYVDELTLDAWEQSPNWEMFDLVRKLKEEENVNVFCVAYGGLFNSYFEEEKDNPGVVITTEDFLLDKLQKLGHLKLKKHLLTGAPEITSDSFIDHVVHATEQSRTLGDLNPEMFKQMVAGSFTELAAAADIYMAYQGGDPKTQKPGPNGEPPTFVVPAINVFANHHDLEKALADAGKGDDNPTESDHYIPHKMMKTFKTAWDKLRGHAATIFPDYHSNTGKKNVDPFIEIAYDIHDTKKGGYKNLSKTDAAAQLAKQVGWKCYTSNEVDIPKMLSDQGSSSFTPIEEYVNAVKKGGDSRAQNALGKAAAKRKA